MRRFLNENQRSPPPSEITNPRQHRTPHTTPTHNTRARAQHSQQKQRSAPTPDRKPTTASQAPSALKKTPSLPSQGRHQHKIAGEDEEQQTGTERRHHHHHAIRTPSAHGKSSKQPGYWKQKDMCYDRRKTGKRREEKDVGAEPHSAVDRERRREKEDEQCAHKVFG
jgi:hypothetical protein